MPQAGFMEEPDIGLLEHSDGIEIQTGFGASTRPFYQASLSGKQVKEKAPRESNYEASWPKPTERSTSSKTQNCEDEPPDGSYNKTRNIELIDLTMSEPDESPRSSPRPSHSRIASPNIHASLFEHRVPSQVGSSRISRPTLTQWAREASVPSAQSLRQSCPRSTVPPYSQVEASLISEAHSDWTTRHTASRVPVLQNFPSLITDAAHKESMPVVQSNSDMTPDLGPRSCDLEQSFVSATLPSGPSSSTHFPALNTTCPQSMTSSLGKVPEVRVFDSDAFDAMIYSQIGTTPPRGITIRRTRPPSTATGETLYLHINPYIHLMHARSDVWQKQKTKDIRNRGGRKFWFAQTGKRRRWRLAVDKIEGAAPQMIHPRRGHLGEIPEEDLPDEVKANPAWLKACARLRQWEETCLKRERVRRLA